MTNYADLVDRLRQMAGTAWARKYEHDDVLAQAAEAIEALVAERDEAESSEQAMAILAARLAAAEAERDGMRKDAERLEWAFDNVSWREWHAEFGFNAGNYSHKQLRAAIDAALQPTKEA